MEKTIPTPKTEVEPQHDAPTPEPNTGDRTPAAEDVEKAHSQEPERIVEWGGPNGRYGKLNVILGKGAYKVVWKAIDKEEGIEVAWNCCQTTRSEFNEFSEEVEILKKVRHPNVITFHDSWYSNGEFVFITELMTSGTLREYIKKLRTPSVKIIRRWARQILKGLCYLHSHSPPIIHRDIKCDNIFINGSHGEVKIGDMGTAKMRFGKKYTVIGTPEFMAPEMYEEKGYNEKVDIYAFGMCLLEMVTGEYPFSECKNAAQIYKKVSQGIKPECLQKVQDKEILTIINHCLATENERWSAKKLSDHPFLLEEPEVILASATDNKTKLRLQVLFKGQEKHSIKFEYNRESDTAEDVVREMIQEKVLSSKYQGLVCNEIHRILREISKTAPEERLTGGHRRAPSEYDTTTSSSPSISLPLTRSISRQRQSTGSDVVEVTTDIISRGIASVNIDSPNTMNIDIPSTNVNSPNTNIAPLPTPRRGSISNMDLRQSESFDSESSFKEYPNDCHLDEFIVDVATMVNRPLEKANEWLVKLKSEDIMIVGDLRDLLDEDWARLNLTVFATRAIRNALQSKGKPVGLELLSPRVSGKLSESATSTLNI